MAVAFDGSRVRWYVDGEAAGTSSLGGFWPNLKVISPLHLGGSTAVDLDEVAIYGRALDDG